MALQGEYRKIPHQDDGITILDKILGFLLIMLALSLSTTRGGINTIVGLADLLLIIIYVKKPFAIRTSSSINKAIAVFFCGNGRRVATITRYF